MLGHLGSRWIRPHPIPLLTWLPRLYLLLSVALSIGMLAWPFEFKEVNNLELYGRGIFNTRSDDCLVSWPVGDGQMSGVIFDASEGASNLPGYPFVMLPSARPRLGRTAGEVVGAGQRRTKAPQE